MLEPRDRCRRSASSLNRSISLGFPQFVLFSPMISFLLGRSRPPAMGFYRAA